ncbi:MAG: thiamine pyrophosphate-dependent enzyme, partial [Candidatus Binatia bacterium]
HVDDPAVDFCKLGESFGVFGAGTVRRPEELQPAIEKALKYLKEKKLPVIVDVISEPR